MGQEKNHLSTELENLETAADRDGQVFVENGQVRIVDPVGEGTPALVAPHPGLKILLNGTPLAEPAKVTSQDHVEVSPEEQRVPGELEVKIEENGLQASMKVKNGERIVQKILDTTPAGELQFQLEEERVSLQDITVEMAIEEFARKGIEFGIDYVAVKETVQSADGGWHVVARGAEAQSGTDGYVEVFFNRSVSMISHEKEGLEKVDYRERMIIPSVKEGDKLAQVHPPVPGKAGKKVTGDVIEPPPVKDAQVHCKEGCVLAQDECTVVATTAGRPIAEGKNNEKLWVEHLYRHNENVDMESGNLRFGGSLLVAGDVTEGMTVESGANLEIQGNIAGASVISGGSAVLHKNLINSSVEVGALKDLYLALLPHLRELEEMLLALANAVKQVEETLLNRGENVEKLEVGNLVKLVVDKKLQDLPQKAEELLGVFHESKADPPADFRETIQKLGHYFQGMGYFEIESIEQLEEIATEVNQAGLVAEKAGVLESNIEAHYVQNSTLICSGSVSVKGPGSYNSTFEVGEDLHISGVFRGGSIQVGGDLYIKEAGSPGMTVRQGEITLTSESTARFDRVFENVKLVFGRRSYRFAEERSRVKAYYSAEEDSIKVENN